MIGITAAVPVLMMVPDDGQHVAKGLQRPADALSDGRMLFHDLPLLGRQTCALLEDIVGNGDLSEIMKVAAALQGNDAVTIQADVVPQVGSQMCQPLTVVSGIGIA